ncbi:hypothetical protein TNCV_4352461, partial [Trichonephila clavipes]
YGNILTEAYEDKTLPRACEWHKRLSGVEDDEHAGCPRRENEDQNIAKVHDVNSGDFRLSVRARVEFVNLDREAVRHILTNELHMRKVCVKVVPKFLFDDQKSYYKNVCGLVRTHCKRAKLFEICCNI